MQTVIVNFKVKIGLSKSSLLGKDFQQFLNLWQLEKEKNIPDDDLNIYTKPIDEDFEVHFEDLEKMHVPDQIFTLNSELEKELNLQDELGEMTIDIKAKSLFKCMALSNFWSNVNIVNMYLKLSGKVNPCFTYISKFLFS